ncbi:hypothetical protein RhiJN_17998 [Ceratobasidium sp. AG-Ba]|nr:hypothetical protein RhiJN_17998 [Ceratobasidium sp. AG-Ba]
MSLLFSRAIRPAVVAQRSIAPPISAVRHKHGHMTDDPEVMEREKQKNLQGKQTSTQKHAPGWNEQLASHSEAHIKADQATGTPEEMTSSTIEYLKKQHPDTVTDQIREHTNAPYLKDTIQGPLGTAKKMVNKAMDSVAEAINTDPGEVQGKLSDKGAKAEQARRASMNTSSEDAVKADRDQHQQGHV